MFCHLHTISNGFHSGHPVLINEHITLFFQRQKTVRRVVQASRRQVSKMPISYLSSSPAASLPSLSSSSWATPSVAASQGISASQSTNKCRRIQDISQNTNKCRRIQNISQNTNKGHRVQGIGQNAVECKHQVRPAINEDAPKITKDRLDKEK